MLGAARLLAHAKLDVICWNGSKGVSLGFDADRALCERITAETGIPATTSVLALDAVLRGAKVRNIGLVSPHTDAYQAKMTAALREARLSLRRRGAFGLLGQFLLLHGAGRRHRGDDPRRRGREARRDRDRSAPIFRPRIWSRRWSRRPAFRFTTRCRSAYGTHCAARGLRPHAARAGEACLPGSDENADPQCACPHARRRGPRIPARRYPDRRRQDRGDRSGRCRTPKAQR